MTRSMMMSRAMRTTLAVLVVLALQAAAPTIAAAQKAFATPDAAVAALVDSLARHDDAELALVLGPDYRRLVPGGVLAARDRTDFLAAWAQGHRVLRDGDSTARLELKDGWTLPVPIVRSVDGWSFDTRAGIDAMRTRLIGRNELAAIQSMYAYVDAQREYAQKDRNGDGLLEYAQRILSTPGKRDGLYWSTSAGEPPSPLGPLLDTADLEDGYHGYQFRVLKAQGPGARGGARSYINRGRMTDGFAMVAWPARFGETGVMTFLVNHDGVVFQKNLGPTSATIAQAMTRFDPDGSWVALSAP